MFPAFAHFRRTATRDTELGGSTIRRGRQGGHVVRLVQPRRVRPTRTPTASTCAATRSTRPSARAAGTSASAPRWRAWSCGSSSRRRWRATRRWSSRARPRYVESPFVNQLKTLPVRLTG